MQSKKIIFTIILSIMFVLLLSTKIFAIEVNGVTMPEFPVEVADFDYYTILYYDNTYSLYISAQPFTITASSSNSSSGSIDSFDNDNKVYCYRLSSGSWSYIYQYVSVSGWDCSINNCLYSSYSVKDLNGNVVFQAPPQEQEQEQAPETTQEIILAPIVEEIQMKVILAEVVALLPMMMMILVSLLAFYKGWQILQTLLQTS